MMTDRFPTDPLQYLLSEGFELANLELRMAHFGNTEYKSVDRCGDYLVRKTDAGRYQYFFLCRYEGKVVEVVFEEYLAPKNTRKPKGEPKVEKLKPGEFSEYQKKGFSTVDIGICRNLVQVVEIIKK